MTIPRAWPVLVFVLGAATTAVADPLKCDVSQYKAAAGLTASVTSDALLVSWAGQSSTELRSRYAIDGGQPRIRELAIRKAAGSWAVLGRDLAPEYRVTSGVRRMTEQQAQPLRQLGVEITPEVIDQNRWYAFWDSPLIVPGYPERQAEKQAPASGRVLGLPRRPEEIRRASAVFHAEGCEVKTEGLSLQVSFPGLSMGIFAGSLRFTVYRGQNLIRMDAVAKTEEPWVAYKYDAGLQGLSSDLMPSVAWHDTGGHVQRYAFGGPRNEGPVALKAANRVLVAEGRGGSLATFTPPHTFFFTREVDTNLGYVWYRKDEAGKFGIGIRQADKEENGVYAENFALYNAPPRTWQRMGVYFYASAEPAEATRQAVLAFTHGDAFKPLPGYKTFVNHFHLRFTERLRATGSLDTSSQDVLAMKALGLNVVGLSDFHGDLRANDPGPGRFADFKDYAEASRKASDVDFLVTPWEEPSAYFGGHYNILFPKQVYWSKVRQAGQPFTETDPAYGRVYHAGNAADVQQMLDAEGGYWYHAHPRTKGTTGFPDAIFDKDWTRNDRYLGVAFKPGMGMDLSEERLCEWRCFDAADTMNNKYSGSGLRPKYVIADIDTYQKAPEDDLYPNFPVNYLRLDKLPGPDEDWSPVLRALRNGDFFVTTGEILIKSYAVQGAGTQRTITADAEWTYPLSFVEVVWGDGSKIGRRVISATDLPGFSGKRFTIPFDATGKAWVRFAIWDSAGNGAFVQPVWLRSN